ncbi:MAG: flagellar hook-length control protein FliK [Paracoccaceae bacterium]
MHMHLALFSGPADPQIASQTVEGAKVTAGGALFASLVEGGDQIALPTPSMDVVQANVQIPAVAALPFPQNLKGMAELGQVRAAAQPLAETAPLPLGAQPPSEIRDPLPVRGAPAAAEVQDAVPLIMPIDAPFALTAPVIKDAPLETVEAAAQSLPETKDSDPLEPKFLRPDGEVLAKAPLETEPSQAPSSPQISAPQLPFSAPLVQKPVLADAEADAPAIIGAEEAVREVKIAGPEIRVAANAPSLTDQNAQLAGPLAAKTAPLSGSSGEIAAKLLPEAFAPLENPETSAALVKAIAPLPSPEQASAAQAAILYQSGAERAGKSGVTAQPVIEQSGQLMGSEMAGSKEVAPLPNRDTPQIPASTAPAFDGAVPRPETPKREGVSAARVEEIAAPVQAAAAPSVSPTNAAEGQPAARKITPLQAPLEQSLAPPPQAIESVTARVGARQEATNGEPALPRSEAVLPAQTAKSAEPYVLSPRAPEAPSITASVISDPSADLGSMTAPAIETVEPEMQSFGLGASPSEARVGSGGPVPLALLSNPEVPQRVAQQIAEAARALPDRPVELSLNPEELGRVRMTMHASEGAMSVVMAVERAETLDLMRRHIETLAAEFRAMGYRDVSFSFSQQGQGGPGDESPHGRNSAQTPGPLDEAAALQNTPHKLALDGAGGMDIRL